jgi:peptidoglycan/xylan/chitin deacetylase (PgdA/CDA1 family)
VKLDVMSLADRIAGCGGVMAYHGVVTSPLLRAMHITPERFRRHMEFLQQRYCIIPLMDMVDRWRRGASTNGYVAITFDDAYAGVRKHAMPVLRDLNIPATIFVASDHAQLGATYWWDEAERERVTPGGSMWTTRLASVGLPPLGGSDPRSMESLRTRVLARYFGRWPTGIRPSDDEEWRSLRFDELRALASEAQIDFGVHTLSHPSLPSLAYDDQVAEIRENLLLLGDRLPSVRPIVAYPYGLYDRTTIRAAAEAGMICGVTMEGRAPSGSPSLFTVPRVGCGEVHDIRSVSRRLSRALRPFLVARNGSIHPRVPRPE